MYLFITYWSKMICFVMFEVVFRRFFAFKKKKKKSGETARFYWL